MKAFNSLFLIFLCSLCCNAQISTYFANDITKAVYEVDDMQSQEIKDYNTWKKQGWGDGRCLLHANADRAHANLIKSPATILSFVFWGDVTAYDKMPEFLGAKNISIQLINTTFKTIKSITFEFSFYKKDGTQVFDTKTGDPYCLLTFSNLKGRANSNVHKSKALDLFNCYHLLTLKDATKRALFYNNKAEMCQLEGVNVIYEDGTMSKEASLMHQTCTTVPQFLKLSPFAPILDSYDYAVANKKSFLKNNYQSGVANNSNMADNHSEEIFDPDARQVGTINEDRGTDDITIPTEQAHQEVVQSITEVKPLEDDSYDELKKEEPKPEKDEVYTSATHMPSYPGGDIALMKYLSDHLRYPAAAADNNIQGKVIVQFVITKTGKIGDVKVVRSVDKDLDREAIRVCKSLPAFTPGRNAFDEPVNVWYTLPVTFKLEEVICFDNLLSGWGTLHNKLKNLLIE